MNRNKQVAREIEHRNINEPFEQDAFREGVLWADTHPIYPDGIPHYGQKTDAEVLVLMGVVLRESGEHPAISELVRLLKENVKKEQPLFSGLEYIRFYRSQKPEQNDKC